jgi:oligopeptidase A
VTVRPAQQKLPVWHPAVEVYEVADAGSDTPMAYLYLDLFGRPGSKNSGAWVQLLADRASYFREASPAARAAFALRARGVNVTSATIYGAQLAKEQADWLARATLQLPVAVLVSNQNPPAGGKPSLMTLDDAETLFHEFGHSLQGMLTRTTEGLNAGMRWGGGGAVDPGGG